MSTPSFIIILAVVAIALGALAMLDNWAYAQLCEQHGSDDNWRTSPEGRLAHKPYGALFVVVRQLVRSKK
jgi:hypothetical protein